MNGWSVFALVLMALLTGHNIGYARGLLSH